jgi:Flp pilus assembly protein TadG
MVEFALCVPFLVIIVLGTIDGGRLFATWNRAKTAAREGAVYAQTFPVQQVAAAAGGCADPNNITSKAKSEGSDVTITVSPAVAGCTVWCPLKTAAVQPPQCANLPASSIQPGDEISVVATTPFTFVTPFARNLWSDPTVRATVKVTVQG